MTGFQPDLGKGPPTPSPSSSPPHPSTIPGYLTHIVNHLPPWLGPVSSFLVAIIAWLLLPQQVIGGLRWIVSWWRKRQPKGDKRRAAQRARFASAMAAQVARVSELEEWRDERFAEMDAEVEVHGRQRQGLWRRRGRETIRRVPSLTVALEESTDPIILLEGEPGSGKSVALRHVALRLATEVKEHPSEHRVIPLYLNLKSFRPVGHVDAGAVLNFVKESVNRANDRYVDSFLEQEFDRGIEEGTWLFLFDSFDEIPAVLGAVEADEIIEKYADALYDFLTGMNVCRGVIATREFRGPKRISWPRFRVLRLTSQQRNELIEKLDLPQETERRILSSLATAEMAVKQLAENPLFLALLCEYQRDMHDFPQSSHVVFENYIAKRFSDDSKRLVRRFKLTAEAIRIVAEKAAYCMAAEPGLGLSPSRTNLIAALQRSGFEVSNITSVALDALEYLRLARTAETADGATAGFTFAHRRFQEYFATCLVMQEESRIEPLSLLTDGRWRETAVTLLQTQDKAELQPLLKQAMQLLTDMIASLGANEEQSNIAANDHSEDDDSDLGREVSAAPFDWPPGSLHLLGLLEDGLPIGDHRRSHEVGELAGRLLKKAYSHGQLHDRRWAVEACMAAEPETAWDIVRQAFASASGWLREAAYTQAGRLDEVPDDVRRQMRTILAQLAAGGRLRQQRLAIDAQIRRLADPHPELILERLFLYAPFVNAILWVSLGLTLSFFSPWTYLPLTCVCVAAGVGVFYIDRDARRLDWEVRNSGWLAKTYMTIETVTGRITQQVVSSFTIVLVVYSATFITLGLSPGVKGVPIASLVAVPLCIFLASWGLAANRADWILADPNLLKIVALPLAWLYRAISALRKRKLRQHLTFAIGIIIAATVVAFGTVWVKHLPAWVITVCALGFALFLLIVVTRGIYKNLHQRWSDNSLLNKLECDQLRCEGFAEMLDLLAKFRTQRGLLLFVQEVKRRRVAVQHPGALRALQVFVATLQAGSRYTARSIFVPGIGEELPSSVIGRLDDREVSEVRSWANDVRSSKAKIAVSQPIMDEIGKIVADVERARLVALPVAEQS